MRATRIAGRASATALGMVLLTSAPALAAGVHAPSVSPADVLGIGHAVGGVFGGIGHAVLGAFSWTFGLATKFILVTLGAVVKLLIPRSWANQGVQIMQWIVQVPNYAGRITSPAGQRVYGFAGINELRDLFTWIGMALLPLTLVYSTSRAMIGHGDHVAIPIIRVLVLGAALISYPYWWSQSSALVNQLTHTVLSVPAVTSGLHKLMLYAVDGAALGGWQLIDLGLMAAIAIELLGLIFLKVAIVLLGALLYATGPITIGLIPTEAGAAITRAWASAAITLLALPIVWAAVFAVGAVLINDAGTAGPLLAGHSNIGSLLGGILLAVAGLASLWVCLRAAREAGGLLRVQVGGLLALSHARSTVSSQSAARPNITAARSLRNFQTRVADTTATGSEPMARVGASNTRLARAAGLAAAVGRRGVVGTAGATGRAGIAYGAAGSAALIGRARAGAVAAQMARAGTASWQRPSMSQATTGSQPATNQPSAAPTTGPTPTSNGQSHDGSRAGTPRREDHIAPEPPPKPRADARPQATPPVTRPGASAPNETRARATTTNATPPAIEPAPSQTAGQRRIPSRNPKGRKR